MRNVGSVVGAAFGLMIGTVAAQFVDNQTRVWRGTHTFQAPMTSESWIQIDDCCTISRALYFGTDQDANITWIDGATKHLLVTLDSDGASAGIQFDGIGSEDFMKIGDGVNLLAMRFERQLITIADDTIGASQPTEDIDVDSNYLIVDCEDADGCILDPGAGDVGELGLGQLIIISVEEDTTGTVTVTDSGSGSAVRDMAGNFVGGGNDTLTLIMTNELLVEIGRSDN